MKKAIFLVILMILGVMGCQNVDKSSEAVVPDIEQDEADKDPKVCLKDKCFTVEVADSSSEHAQGLMNRESLVEDAGMLFVFNDVDFHSFWMKDTYISLDLLWIDENGYVVDFFKGAKSCINQTSCPIYTPIEASKYVLELNEGIIEELGIEVGNKVTINI